MPFDFDTVIERRHTGSQKWDRYGDRDVLPMWVADMDFRAPPAVIEALRTRVDHGIFGYTTPDPARTAEVAERLTALHGWQIHPDWIVWLPGVNVGMNLAARATGEPGQGVAVLTPIYPPFFSAPQNAGRPLIRIPLLRDAQFRYHIDFDALDASAASGARTLLLCNPHNPVGRVWSRAELIRIAELAEKHDWVIVSDEIHCGLVLDGIHLPTGALGESIARRTIALYAPSKTYNLPGLTCALAVITDENLRRRFNLARKGLIPDYNVLGMVAAHAAWMHGEPWRQALVNYLRSNRDHLYQRVAREAPQLDQTRTEATYLAWFDARRLGWENPAALLESKGLGVNEGSTFGSPGFFRLNFGCPRQTLDQGIDRLVRAVRDTELHG